MCKKLSVVAVAVIIGATLLFVLDPSWVYQVGRTCVNSFRTSVHESVSPETHIKMLKNELKDVKQEANHYVKVYAKKKAELEFFEQDVNRLAQNVQERTAELRVLHQQYKSGKEFVTVDNKEFTRTQLESDMTRRLKELELAEGKLEVKRELLAHEKGQLALLKQKLDEFEQTCEGIRIEITRLETQLAKVRVAQSKTKVEFESKGLRHLQQQLETAKKRVRAMEIEMATKGQTTAKIPVGKQIEQQKALKKIEARFGSSPVAAGTK